MASLVEKERWQSGRMRTLGKRVKVNSLSRVRIPLSPPKPLLVNALKVLKTMRRMCFKDIYFRRIDYD